MFKDTWYTWRQHITHINILSIKNLNDTFFTNGPKWVRSSKVSPGARAETENVTFGRFNIFNFSSATILWTLGKKSIIQIFDKLWIDKTIKQNIKYDWPLKFVKNAKEMHQNSGEILYLYNVKIRVSNPPPSSIFTGEFHPYASWRVRREHQIDLYGGFSKPIHRHGVSKLIDAYGDEKK